MMIKSLLFLLASGMISRSNLQFFPYTLMILLRASRVNSLQSSSLYCALRFKFGGQKIDSKSKIEVNSR
jgi:hypothetical protein